ncbi:MAG: hypothetical protein HC802_03270 [Caldilineaceae bacterium]|nr:hypothetical protein [Caldilineaceae bacterium]
MRYVPILSWLSTYQRVWLSVDLVAGATAAAVVIPQAMAYATIADLPVCAGPRLASRRSCRRRRSLFQSGPSGRSR